MDKRTKNHLSILKAYQTVFSSDHGKLVLLDLMKSCHIMQTIASSDPLAMATKEGERLVVLRILNRLKWDLKKYQKVLEEMPNINDEP